MKKAIIRPKKTQLDTERKLKREALERKVDVGVKRAVEEYREVFKKLAEYDRA